MRLWCTCMPLPLTPQMGFGMNVAWRPCFLATALRACLRANTRSAEVMASAYLRSISYWLGATS